MKKLFFILLAVIIFFGCNKRENIRTVNNHKLKNKVVKKKKKSSVTTHIVVTRVSTPENRSNVTQNTQNNQNTSPSDNRVTNNENNTQNNIVPNQTSEPSDSQVSQTNNENNQQNQSENQNTENNPNQNNGIQTAVRENNGPPQDETNNTNVEIPETNRVIYPNYHPTRPVLYKTRYISYIIGKRVKYKTRLRWIRGRTRRTERRLKLKRGSLIPIKVGSSLVYVEQYIKGSADITYFFVHPNELTGYTGLKRHIKKHGGRGFLFIGTGKRMSKRIRYLIYKIKRFPFALDPNRIFTRRSTLRNEFLKVGRNRKFWANNRWCWRRFGKIITRQVGKLSGFYKALAKSSSDPVVAVHDNTGYLNWAHNIFLSRDRLNIAKKWNWNRKKWRADFIYVIRSEDYVYFKSLGYNVILQNNDTVPDDGSTSVYFSKLKRWYICIEVGRTRAKPFARCKVAMKMLDKIRKYILSKRQAVE